MPIHEPPNEREQAASERLRGYRDAVEQAQAHLAAAEVPKAWVDTGPEGADLEAALAASAYSLDADLAQELLTPLDAETRGRIADDVLGAYLAEGGDQASIAGPEATPTPGASPPVAANDGGGRRRWWALPMTAVAAVLLTLLYVDLRGSAGASADVFDGETLLSSRARGASERGAPAQALTVAEGGHFDIHCRVKGREVEVTRVMAKRSDGTGKDYTLAFVLDDDAGDGAVAEVTADLAKGSWGVSCEVEERSSGARSWVGSAATLKVQRAD